MQEYTVTGMSCAACSKRVEDAVKNLPGVESCSVNLLTSSMEVFGSITEESVIKAVREAGYGASIKLDEGIVLEDVETPKLKKRLIESLIFLLPLMYISMGHTMWNLPVPAFLESNYFGIGIIQLMLTLIISIINGKFFVNGVKGVLHKAPNMDTLVAIGASASIVYSMYGLYQIWQSRDQMEAMSYMHDLYFESAGMILTLITVGKLLESISKGKTTSALKGLIKMIPQTATILVDGQEKQVEANTVKVGDVFVVKPGENIPIDGTIIFGETCINESALTGESMPVPKSVNSNVYTATNNIDGYIKCRATAVGTETTLSKIIKLVSTAASSKAPIALVADKVSGVFVPVVMLISFITTIIWLLLGNPLGFAIARGISVLVISCPCALGLATPVAVMVGTGMGAKSGILFKTAESLEITGQCTTVILDKTGTITKGEPRVTDIIPNLHSKVTEIELLETAYSIEKQSEHPLARAIVNEGNERGVKEKHITSFHAKPGNGITAGLLEQNGNSGRKIFLIAGNMKFVETKIHISDEFKEISRSLSKEGKTPLFFARGNDLLGIIAVADVVKEDSYDAVRQLKAMGLKVVMLTGDNKDTAKAIADLVGIDNVISSVLPEGKSKVVNAFKEHGQVIMVGDGINDAPALVEADAGVAIGAGADIAIDAADVVIEGNSLLLVPQAIRLSIKTLTNIYENLFWAFIYNIIGIPLAAGAYITILGWALNPMFAAAAMSLSSFCVVMNALRLNFFDINNDKFDSSIARKVNRCIKRAEKKRVKEKGDIKKYMEKTVRVEGMMCSHCENTVRDCIKNIPGVTDAKVDHTLGEVIVISDKEISDQILTEAIESKGYRVIK